MSTGPTGVGVIGAGVISRHYLRHLVQFPDLAVRGVADLDTERASAIAEMFDVPRLSVAELLRREDIEIVLNLTVPAAHFEVSHQILDAGKHVWSEKPLTLSRDEANTLNDRAAAKGLRVGCAPDTILGAPLQTAQRQISGGRLGTVHSALAVVQSPGPEGVHPHPAFYYADGAGPVLDMGPYYVTAMVQMLGPIDEVVAIGGSPKRHRRVRVGPNAGADFPISIATHTSALLTFASGATGTLLTSFDSGVRRDQLEFYGTDATLQVPNPNHFDGDATLTRLFGEAQPVPSVGASFGRGLGVLDLARSVAVGEPERASGVLAAHVLDVLVSINESVDAGRAVPVRSTVSSPALLPEGWDPAEATFRLV